MIIIRLVRVVVGVPLFAFGMLLAYLGAWTIGEQNLSVLDDAREQIYT